MSQYDSFTQKMGLKRLFLSDTLEDYSCTLFWFPWRQSLEEIVLLRKWSWKGHSLVTQWKPLHIHCWGPLGDRALMSWYDSFIQRMVLKMPLVSNNGKDSLCMFIIQFSQETEKWVKRIVLLGRQSWKGCSSVTLGKTLLCIYHCSGLLAYRTFE